MTAPLIEGALVRLDADLGADKHQVIRCLAEVVGAAGRAATRPASPRTRSPGRRRPPTGLPGGIAIPHCRTEHVDVPTLAFARLAPRVDFGAKDGPADLAFLIAAPAGGDATHLQMLTKLARALVKKDVHRGAARRRRRPRRSSPRHRGRSASAARRPPRRRAAAAAGAPAAAPPRPGTGAPTSRGWSP